MVVGRQIARDAVFVRNELAATLRPRERNAILLQLGRLDLPRDKPACRRGCLYVQLLLVGRRMLAREFIGGSVRSQSGWTGRRRQEKAGRRERPKTQGAQNRWRFRPPR